MPSNQTLLRLTYFFLTAALCLIYYLQYQHISQQGDDDDTKFINLGAFSPYASLELTLKEMNGHPARAKCDTLVFGHVLLIVHCKFFFVCLGFPLLRSDWLK